MSTLSNLVFCSIFFVFVIRCNGGLIFLRIFIVFGEFVLCCNYFLWLLFCRVPLGINVFNEYFALEYVLISYPLFFLSIPWFSANIFLFSFLSFSFSSF